MTEYFFKRQQTIPIKLNEAWDFFSNPKNLCKITPDSLGFRIISDVPAKIYEGLELEYKAAF